MRWNSQSITLSILKCTTQWHLVYLQCCATITFIQLQNIFITTREDPIPIKQSLSIPSSTESLKITNLISVIIDLPTLDFHINGITEYVTFWVWLLSVFKVHSHCSMYQYSVPFYDSNILSIYHILIMCSCVDGHLSCFFLLAIRNSVVMNIYVQGFV